MTDDLAKQPSQPPILAGKHYRAPSEFTPENLLRHARRQNAVVDGPVPDVCILDPDGDIVRELVASGRARRSPEWACYHTDLHHFTLEGIEFGIVGCAVGAAFAVLVAEEMFAAGCRLLVSMTSSGQILPVREPPYFVLIDRALRDEGTSYHYLPPADYSDADPVLIDRLEGAFSRSDLHVERGATWTTDAPFRETAKAIAARKAEGILAVEMEAAALYAFARARHKDVLCFAHVTNRMGRVDEDFEKGEAQGSSDALQVILAAVRGCT